MLKKQKKKPIKIFLILKISNSSPWDIIAPGELHRLLDIAKSNLDVIITQSSYSIILY